MKRKNPCRSVVLTEELMDALDKYAVTKHITGSQAIRQFIEQGLSVESYKQHQSEIRSYIREEIETVLPMQIKPYMERLIKMQANATRTSAAALVSNVSIIAENYIDTATPEEILANAFKMSSSILKTRPKTDEEYLAEARQWLNVELTKPKRTEEPEQTSYEEHWEDITFTDNFDEEYYNNLTEEQMSRNEDWANVTFLDKDDNAKSAKGEKYKRSPMQWSDDFKNAKELANNGDYKGALELYKKEAEKRNPLAIYEIADLYRKTLLEGENPYGYYKSALDIFKEIEPTTRKLKPYVQYRIGRMYYDGYGTEKNFETAFYWLKMSADGGNHNAEYTLGRMLYTGTGTEQDKVTAIDYLQRAAKKVSAACIYLGNIELNDNKDNPHSEANAIGWYKKAVDMKNADGAYKLHKIYRKKEDTQGLSIEYLNKAIDLYSKRKDINATLMLGKIYADPDTPKYDFNKAEELLLRAATHKDIDVSSQAAYPLANLYLRQGVTRYSDALKWFVKAFDSGNNYSAIGAAKILCDNESELYNIEAAKDWLTKALERATEKESEVDEKLVAQLNYKLGKIYASKEEEAMAIKYLDAAIKLYEKQDDINAVFMLGKIYADPDTPKYDFNRAEELLLRAATHKDIDVSSQAAYPLANLYLREGVTRYSDALKWFVKAFDSGNNYSAIGAAKILCDNESELYNIEAAKDWLTKALERATSKKGEIDKNVISQLNYKLGKLYTLDEKYYYPQLAEHHLKQAVQLGNAYAMYSLAKLYLSDESFDKLDVALLLLKNAKAANKDIAPFADFTLGVTYLYNDKVKDIALGKQYLTASANAGNEFAKQVLDSFNSNSIVRMLTATGRLLDRIGADENAALNNCAKSVFGRGDLSKEQIKELLLKMQDKENTAEM